MSTRVERNMAEIRYEREMKELKERNEYLTRLAKKLMKAGYSECVFSDFEYYPVMAREFPEVLKLSMEDEQTVIDWMETFNIEF